MTFDQQLLSLSNNMPSSESSLQEIQTWCYLHSRHTPQAPCRRPHAPSVPHPARYPRAWSEPKTPKPPCELFRDKTLPAMSTGVKIKRAVYQIEAPSKQTLTVVQTPYKHPQSHLYYVIHSSKISTAQWGSDYLIRVQYRGKSCCQPIHKLLNVGKATFVSMGRNQTNSGPEALRRALIASALTDSTFMSDLIWRAEYHGWRLPRLSFRIYKRASPVFVPKMSSTEQMAPLKMLEGIVLPGEECA